MAACSQANKQGTAEQENTIQDPALQENTILGQFLDTMQQLKDLGDEYSENGMPLQAEYFYSIAGSSTSAFRFAVDQLLFIKGEGASLTHVVGEAYGDWDTIASINFASPYPYYFQGLIYQVQGDLAKAEECYRNSILNENYPEEAVSFYYLSELNVEQLLDIKAELVSLEEDIYSVYLPTLDFIERNPMNFNDEYLRAAALESLNQNSPDYDSAEQFYKSALRVNPFEPKNFAALALLAIDRGDSESAIFYVNEGLWMDGDDAALNQIADILSQRVEGESQ